MHSHTPADSVSAMRYALRQDSSSAHPEGEYPVFPAKALPEELSYAVRRLNP